MFIKNLNNIILIIQVYTLTPKKSGTLKIWEKMRTQKKSKDRSQKYSKDSKMDQER